MTAIWVARISMLCLLVLVLKVFQSDILRILDFIELMLNNIYGQYFCLIKNGIIRYYGCRSAWHILSAVRVKSG